jgi:Uma2 family endonuclease
MAMPAVNRRWTAREVRALISESPKHSPRYELVDGELLVTPSPNRWHQAAVVELIGLLRDYLRTYPVGHLLASPSDVELEAEFLSQPDVFVVPTREWRRMGGEHTFRELLLVIEVLSPSSGRYDRVRKRPMYQRHVPEYWIVDIDARLFERWRPGDSRPEILTEILEWSLEGAPEPFRLDVARFFARVLDDGEQQGVTG